MGNLQIDLKKTALVMIDLQRGIIGMPCEPYSGPEVVERAGQLTEAFRDQGGFVVFVKVSFHDGQDALQPATDEPAAGGGTRPEGWDEFIPELSPQKGDLVVAKRQWGAFFGTELDLQLRRRGIDTIVLCGIATHIGVDTTAREAYQRGYNQVFVSDAMAAMSEADHHYPLRSLFPRMGKIRTTEEVLQALK